MLRTIWLLEFEWSSTPLYFNDTSYCNGFLYFHTLPFYIYIYGVLLANFQRNVLNAGVSCISLHKKARGGLEGVLITRKAYIY